MWSKRNPCTLLVGMQTGEANVENRIEVPQKLKIEVPYDPVITLLGINPNKMHPHVYGHL